MGVQHCHYRTKGISILYAPGGQLDSSSTGHRGLDWKTKIVRVHYMGPRQRSIVDYDALAEQWRQQFGRRSSMLRAKRIEYKKDRERLERRFGQRRGR